MTVESKKIDLFIPSQFPRFYDEEGPVFIEFVRSYYEWMGQENNVINMSRSLQDNRDIDSTLEKFMDHFRQKYMFGIPNTQPSDKRFLIKHILDLYRAKGTEQGFKLLFRLLFNEEVRVYTPSVDILSPSSGTWYQAQYLEVDHSEETYEFIGKIIRGSSSKASAVVEAYITQPIKGRLACMLYLSNVSGDFVRGEKIVLQENFNTAVTLDSPTLLGSLNSINIISGGKGFAVGETLKVTTGSGIEGEVRVTETATGFGSLNFNIDNGGTLYSLNAHPIITRNISNGQFQGAGATFSIGQITDLSNITYNTDFVNDTANTLLFFNNSIQSVNVLTAGSGYTNGQFLTITSGVTIDSVNITSGGTGYTNGQFVKVTGGTVQANGFIVTDNTGVIIAVDVTSPGAGFGTPVVTPCDAVGTPLPNQTAVLTATTRQSGSGANLSITTNATGNVTLINVLAAGNSYAIAPTITYVGAGTGATFKANLTGGWGFSNSSINDPYASLNGLLTYKSDLFGRIAALSNISGGNSYTVSPTIKVSDLVLSRPDVGTIKFSNTGATLTGTGTSFTTSFVVGDIVAIETTPGGFDYRVVTNVFTATSMTLDDNLRFTCNGNIVAVNITTPGVSYSNTDTITITGTGTLATAQLVTSLTGAITGVSVTSQGSGYTGTPTVSITTSTGSGAALTAVIATSKYYRTQNTIKANFATYEPLYFTANGSINGNNAIISATPVIGAGIIRKVEVKNSGFSYVDNEIVTMYPYGSISAITISNGGRSYANNAKLVFSGGEPSQPAVGTVQVNANGTITGTTLSYAGSGYKTPPVLAVAGGDRQANLVATIGDLNLTTSVTGNVVKGGLGKLRGIWTSTRGFLNSDKYVQDSYYYQEYSYELQSSLSLDKYSDIVKTTYHPSGTELFGRIVKQDIQGTDLDVAFEQITHT
jgi:hypothetical protein